MSKNSPKRRRSSNPTSSRRKQTFPWFWVLSGVGVAAIVIALVINVSRAVISIPGEITYGPFVANQHTTAPVSYDQTPPVGGPHNPGWQNCGIYDQPVQNELGVHSMEHGAVWITYQPELDEAGVEQLRSLVRGRTYTLLSPYPELPSPVVASAWGVQVQVDSPDDPRLADFVRKYRNGQQTPEPGALCSSGVGTPIER